MLKAFARDVKHIREEKNISLRDIANRTRLNISVLESLENGDYTFQPQTYIRAFLKQYIAALDLDVDEILFDYDLARSGKYKPKFQHPAENETKDTGKEGLKESRETKYRFADKLKGIVDTPKKILEEKKTEVPAVSEQKKESENVKEDTLNKSADIKSENKVSLKTNEARQTPYPASSNSKKQLSFSFLNSPVIKNIFTVVFVILVLLGLYSIINILFIEGKNDKPEIIRQNFDEVVKEQERKLLGKRTPEEISDSIRRANEVSLQIKDTITLKITSLSPGSVFLSYDSINYNKPEKIEFEKDEVGIFKAAGFFHISSGNTGSFKATVNNIPLKFDSKSVSKVKITKDGIFKTPE